MTDVGDGLGHHCREGELAADHERSGRFADLVVVDIDHTHADLGDKESINPVDDSVRTCGPSVFRLDGQRDRRSRKAFARGAA
ncbi:hypothetical protein [Intrasporangium mesophilum]